MPSTRLMRYDAARLALAEAHRVDEAKDIRDKALALAAYARQAKDRDMVAWATEIKLRAERRTGELLLETAKSAQRNTGGKPSARSEGLPTLKKMGISEDQSSDWQKLAAIPEQAFEQRIKDAAGEPAALTTARILKPPAPIRANPFEDEVRVWAGVSGWPARAKDLPAVKTLKSVRPKGGLRAALREHLVAADGYLTTLKRLHKEDWL